MARRVILIFLILLSCASSYSQDILDYVKIDSRLDRKLLIETRSIMNILGFKVRKTLYQDGAISLDVKKGAHYLDASFNNNFGEDFLAPYSEDRWYQAPFLIITELCFNVITKAKDTTLLYYLRAKETIVHELTHYLQASFDIVKVDPIKDYKGYFSQKTEFEAYSVGAYYFLKHYDSAKLKNILKLNVDKISKCKILVNAYFKVIYPNNEPIFDVEAK